MDEAIRSPTLIPAAHPHASEAFIQVEVSALRSELYALLGQCMHENGELRRALDAYDAAIQLQPSHGILLLLRAAANYRCGAYVDAHDDIRQALAPGAMEGAPVEVVAEAQQLLGLSLARCGEMWGAIAALSAALHLVSADEAGPSTTPPSSPRPASNPAAHPAAHHTAHHTARLLVQRGTVLLMCERLEGAVEDFSAAIELRPGWALALHRRGFALKALLQVEGAVGIQRDPAGSSGMQRGV